MRVPDLYFPLYSTFQVFRNKYKATFIKSEYIWNVRSTYLTTLISRILKNCRYVFLNKKNKISLSQIIVCFFRIKSDKNCIFIWFLIYACCFFISLAMIYIYLDVLLFLIHIYGTSKVRVNVIFVSLSFKLFLLWPVLVTLINIHIRSSGRSQILWPFIVEFLQLRAVATTKKFWFYFIFIVLYLYDQIAYV